MTVIANEFNFLFTKKKKKLLIMYKVQFTRLSTIVCSTKVDSGRGEGRYSSKPDHDWWFLSGRGSGPTQGLGHRPEAGRGGGAEYLAPPTQEVRSGNPWTFYAQEGWLSA